MTSLRKLAQLAGVSRMTVARALREQNTVDPETAQRIRELAEMCHYRPNRLTQGLLSGKSNMIGCLVPAVNTSFFDCILRGVIESAYAQDYHVTILQTHNHLPFTLAALETLVDRRVEGVLLAAGHLEPLPQSSLLMLRSHDIVPIGIDCTVTREQIDVVQTDEQRAAELVVDYLINLGHERIAYVGPCYQGHRSMRMTRIQKMLHARGLSSEYTTEYPLINSAEEALRILWDFPQPPTALIAFNDFYAAELMKKAISLGMRIPHDLSIIGFGNLPICPLLTPALTSLEQNPVEIGKQAVSLLFRRLQEHSDGQHGCPERIMLAPMLIERESCASPTMP